VDGGFVAEDPNPFKEKPKSNNVLEMPTKADDDDGFDEEPVKKTVKKAAVNSTSSGDLNDIVDDLFDDED